MRPPRFSEAELTLLAQEFLRRPGSTVRQKAARAKVNPRALYTAARGGTLGAGERQRLEGYFEREGARHRLWCIDLANLG